MIIISKFRDYYDSAAAHGVATDLRYIRTSQIVEKESYSYYKYRENDISCVTIGFCGKIYFCYVRNKFNNEEKKEYYYTLEDIINKYINTLDYSFYPRWYFRRNTNNTEQRRKDDIKEWEKIFKKNEDEIAPKYIYLFLKYRVPIFKEEVIFENSKYYNTLELNPRLNLYEFYRIFDTYMAYQEISMFLGGMASPEKEIPKIDDKIMAAAKGFDKYSFRKDKQKK